MMGEDPDAARPHEELVPGWHVPGRTRYDYDLRIGDAERDIAMTQLREHFVAGRLTFDELTERIDAALVAKTQRQVDRLLADLPRPPRPPRAAHPEAALPVPAPDAGRFLVFAMLLFALATWILIMAWMARHSYYGQLPQFPRPPAGGLAGQPASRPARQPAGQALARARSGTTR